MHHQLKITLQDVDPPVWRRVLVPSEMTLFELHHVIQIVMGWDDSHLHDFTIKKQRYTLPSVEDFDADESKARLLDVVRPRSKFAYLYDFGDDWHHVILVEKVIHDDTVIAPVCIAGERACPPEDSGGPWGYEQKLEALSNGADDEESEELREWMGADFDPELFNVDLVNRELKKIFSSAPKKRSAHPQH
jgi:hypothetical protein